MKTYLERKVLQQTEFCLSIPFTPCTFDLSDHNIFSVLSEVVPVSLVLPLERDVLLIETKSCSIGVDPTAREYVSSPEEGPSIV